MFESENKTPAKAPAIDIPLRKEFVNKIFSVPNHYILKGTRKL
jgi:hypothetical protein